MVYRPRRRAKQVAPEETFAPQALPSRLEARCGQEKTPETAETEEPKSCRAQACPSHAIYNHKLCHNKMKSV